MKSELLNKSEIFNSNLIKNTGVNIGEKEINSSLFNLGNSYLVKKVIDKALMGEKVTLCAFGGSITQGAGFDCVPVSDSGIKSNLPF